MLLRNDDGGIKLSSDELSSDDDDDSLINENRQLFRPGPNGMSDDDLSEGILTKRHNSIFYSWNYVSSQYTPLNSIHPKVSFK